MANTLATTCGVYEIRNSVNNNCYVGSSSEIQRRFSNHKQRLRKGRHHNIHLQRAWNIYGEESFKFTLLAIVEEHEKIPTEQRLLDSRKHAGSEYNIGRDAQAPAKGIKRSPEFIAILRDGRRKGVNSPSFGTKRSAETRKLQSELKKGKPSPNIGRKHTQETKNKISAANLGNPSPRKGIHKTHCVNGHAMVESNIYIRHDRGTRSCKACSNAASYKYRQTMEASI